jgi:hypothetical protein
VKDFDNTEAGVRRRYGIPKLPFTETRPRNSTVRSRDFADIFVEAGRSKRVLGERDMGRRQPHTVKILIFTPFRDEVVDSEDMMKIYCPKSLPSSERTHRGMIPT